MARPTNTEQRRAEIVAALGRVMASAGYERATVALVAREAGLGAGLVHYHFDRKEEILLALVDGLAAGAEGRIRARMAEARGSPDRLGAALDALLDRGEGEDREAVACWALIGAEAVKSAEVRRPYERFIRALGELLAGLVEGACREQGRSAVGSAAIAGALVAQVEGYFALAAAVPDAIPAGSAAEMARRTAAGLIAGQPLATEGQAP